MDVTTLEKANELNKMIKEYQQTLRCFEWEKEYGGASTNPRLIIEFDGPDGREQQPIPMVLSDVLVSYLKEEIIKGRDTTVAEFNAL